MKKSTLIAILILGLAWMVSGQYSITISGESIKDTHINSVWDESYSQNYSLVAAQWTYDGIHGLGRSLIKFDLSEVPEFAKVEYAYLSLYHNPTSEHLGHSDMGGDNTGIIMRVAENWNDEEVVWNTQPLTTNTNWRFIYPPETDDQDYPEIDVTKLVQDMVNHPDVQHGFMIKLRKEDALYRSLVFASVDHPDPELRPELYIEYSDNQNIIDVLNIKPGYDKGKDAYINLVNQTPNGNEESLVASVWTHNGTEGTGRFLIDFQLPELIGDKELLRAEINLYHNPSSGHQGHSMLGGSNKLVIQRIIEPWEENTVCWDIQPETTSENQIFVNPSNLDDQHYLNINVTKLVNDIIANPDEGYGLLVKLADEDDLYRSVVFASSDNTNSQLWPCLDIYYGNIITSESILPTEIKFHLFPNPGTGKFNLDIDQPISYPIEASVYDQYGKLVEEHTITDQITVINMTDKPKGIYFIQVKTKSDLTVRKVVIN